MPSPAASTAALILAASRALPLTLTRPLLGISTSTPGRCLAMLSSIAAPQTSFQDMPSTLKLTAVSSMLPLRVIELVELPDGFSDMSSAGVAGSAGVSGAAGAGSGDPQPVLKSAVVASNATARKLRDFIVFSEEIFKCK